MGDNDAPANSSVFDTAMNRWLDVNELETLLTPETTDFPPAAILTLIIATVDASNEHQVLEIVDFAPKRAFIHSKRQSDIALIFSEPLPKNPPDDEIFQYFTFAAFVELSIAQQNSADLEILAINLSPLKCATPTLYHCTIPSDAISGKRRIVVVSGYVYQGAGSYFTGEANNVVVLLKQAWRNASANTQDFVVSSRPWLSLTRESHNYNNQILTQFSEEHFYFNMR